MKIVESVARMSTLVKMLKKEGRSIGFVPTMGALHEGHLSLVRAAKKHADIVVMSIFINPIQFVRGEDFDKYPRDIKKDEEMARSSGVDIVFYPSPDDIYPQGYSTYVEVERLTDGLCGVRRTGHFKGVATVVAKLFNIIRPNIAYFGQKDAQQAIVIKKMVEDLNMGIEVRMLPTVREPDGLAMSSRNAYLSETERRQAPVLYEALRKAESMIRLGEKDPRKVVKTAEKIINNIHSAKVEYLSVVDTKWLKEVQAISGEVMVALAVSFGQTRLIDNVIVKSQVQDAG
jgi:pantoate--beta-alanine ligase